ncbi:MAG: magnesium transporter [Nitriliruptoraceae bacterium]
MRTVADAGPRPDAAALASRRVPVLSPDERAGAVLAGLAGHHFDSVGDLPVCDPDERVVGVVTIESLFAADSDTRISALMDSDPPTLTASTNAEVAVWHAVGHRESSLVLVDAEGRLAGVVPPEQLLEVLLREHDEDVARLGGFLAATHSAEHASRESVRHRLAHRLPWLFVGLAGALAAAVLMDGFEERLRSNLTLALFVPGVVYLADAVGTQTESLVIRGLAIGVKIRDIAVRELITGVLAGVLLGVVFLPVVVLIWGDVAVAISVAVAMAAACATANAVAMALPGIFDRLSIDPAFGSGPLATVIQDLLSILIYLGVAIMIVP